jgi:protein-S-isoprenylcysteine O-methyltransferase Ste14
VPLRPPPFLFIGVSVFGVGAALALVAGYYLITRGRGTPLPLDPPLELVTRGPYNYVRNPQAIAMLVMVVGEIMFIQSWAVWLLLPLTVLYLEVIVGPWEERQLVARHGDRYLAYKARVRKWFPRFK